jgi:hypothetical protein
MQAGLCLIRSIGTTVSRSGDNKDFVDLISPFDENPFTRHDSSLLLSMWMPNDEFEGAGLFHPYRNIDES